MKERANPLLKRFDAVIGRPLVFLLGARAWARRLTGVDRRRLAAVAERLRHGTPPPVVFTLLKSAAIGDTVLMSAVVRDLRRLYPESRIQMACGRSNREAAALIADLDEVVVLPMTSPLAIVRALPSIRADVLIDFDSWPRINALIAAASGSPVTVGFRTAGQHRHYAYTLTVDHDPAIHELDNYRRLVRAISSRAGDAPDGAGSEPLLRVASVDPASSQPPAGRYAVVHMHSGGSQSQFKEWQPAHWRAVVEHLVSRGVRVCLSGGPGERARNEAFRASLPHPDGVEVLPAGSLAGLVARLASASLVVSVDTGVAHLAGAAGAPTIVLHGPTSPARWGARGPRVHHLHDGQKPWISFGFERSASGRRMHVDPARAIALADRLLDEAAADGRA